MSDQGFLAPVVVALPAQIDITNADRAGARLAAALGVGAAVLIADLTATTFCDCAGVRNLLQAHHQAAAEHRQLRLAARSPGVLLILGLLAVDQVLAVYPDLPSALAA